MTKTPGPLHPLPIPDASGDSVAMDFIEPLPTDVGFNTILSITDWLNLEIHIIPMTANITADELATLFFNHWYCENGLPSNIVLDHDKLFTSVASAQLSFFFSFFVTENAVIDVTVREMVTNIAPLHTFQIKKNYPNTCSQS